MAEDSVGRHGHLVTALDQGPRLTDLFCSCGWSVNVEREQTERVREAHLREFEPEPAIGLESIEANTGMDYEQQALDCITRSWETQYNDTSARCLAEAQVWATLKLAQAMSGLVNIADRVEDRWIGNQ